MTVQRAARRIEALYGWLARRFPEEFQRDYGEDMTAAGQETIREMAAVHGWRGFLPIAASLLVDLMRRLLAEHSVEAWHDLRYAVRRLRSSPGFSFVVAFSLGIGISMAAAVFGQLDSMVLRPVAGVEMPKELVTMQRSISYPDYERFRESGHLASAAAFRGAVPLTVETSAGKERLWGQLVSPNYFEALGARVYAGRTLDGGDRVGAPPVAVLSYRAWETHFASQRSVVGSTVRIDGSAVTIVGVAEREFGGTMALLMRADLWMPATVGGLVPELRDGEIDNPKAASFRFVGRLKPGATMAATGDALDALARRIERERGEKALADRGGKRVELVAGWRQIPLRDQDLGLVTGFPLVLVGLTMWIACASAATMLLARGAHRRREFALRLSLGASRARLVRQLLAESVMLSLAGGAVGWALAVASKYAMTGMWTQLPGYVNFDEFVSLDWRTFGATFALSAVTGILFGLAPALRATRMELAQSLQRGSGGRLAGYGWFSSRNMLVLQQVAGSLALLLLTGYVAIAFHRVGQAESPFDARGLHTVTIDPVRDGYGPERSRALPVDLRDRIARIPGVAGAALAENSPLDVFLSSEPAIAFEDGGVSKRTMLSAAVEHVGAGYFETAGLAVLRGREFDAADIREGRRVAVVNEKLAESAWAGEDPIGRTIEVNNARHEVIGVAKGNRSGTMLFLQRPVNGIYLPLGSSQMERPGLQGVTLLVRAAPGVDVAGEVRKAVGALDTDLTILRSEPIVDQQARAAAMFRSITVTYVGFGVFGLALAATGLAGITAYAVARRTREIGIRIALGATRQGVLRLVMREGLALVIVGSGVGMAGAYAIDKLLRGYLGLITEATSTSTSDPVLLFGGPLAMLVVTVVSCYWPARRATKVSPIAALREE